MNVFLDTSVLLKLYLHESDSYHYRSQLNLAGGAIHLSVLSRIEFVSAATKKIRTGAATNAEVAHSLRLFAQDVDTFRWIGLSEILLEDAARLINKYVAPGLRTLDAIQLAAARSAQNEVGLFLTADQQLAAIFEAEGLPTQ